MNANQSVKLPGAFSLIGTNALPPIDNQGAVGSCASQSVTRNQFSNAATRYAHSIGLDTDKTYVFAPKFSYNMSGAGTAWVYEFIMDHGAQLESECMFEKNESGGHIFKKGEEVIAQSAMWHVGKGEMKKALKNRLTHFEQIWTVKEPYNGQLTTTDVGRELLYKIKEAIVGGNLVVTGGYPSRWIYADITGLGTYGKPGEKAIVASSGNAGGGHQVTIVGYDDDITAEFAGVVLKGAFIVANSYGSGWINNGYTYVMYDAINQVSEHEKLNDSKVYSGQFFLTLDEAPKMYTDMLKSAPQILCITRCGEKNVCNESFVTYNIKDKTSGKYLTYTQKAADRGLTLTDEAGEQSEFCFIPYEKLSIFPSFDKAEYKEEYEGTYWIYCPNNDGESDGYRFADAGLSLSASGRAVGIASLNSGRYPQAKSWTVDIPEDDSCFEAKIGIAAGKDTVNERVWTFDQVCFTDWRKDVVTGLPELFAEIDIECEDRLSFTVVMTRQDESGNTVEYMPALFRYGSAGWNPRYCNEDEYVTFSGIVNGEAETGTFALAYSELLKRPEGKQISDYKWGFSIQPVKGKKVAFKGAKLYWGSGDVVISQIKADKKIQKKTNFSF